MSFSALSEVETDLGTVATTPEAVRSYLDAVGDPASAGGAVPPTALAAWAMARLIERTGLPAGTLHASQEVECLRAVHPGEDLRCTVRLAGRSQRAGTEFTTLDFLLRDGAGAPVLRGRTMVMVRGQA